MGKNLVLRERFLLLLAVLLVGVAGGAVSFLSLVGMIPKSGSTVTEKVTEKQVYIENSPKIAAVQNVAGSLVSLVVADDWQSWVRKDGRIQNDCFNNSVNCQHVGVVLTSDGLVISATGLEDKEVGKWLAVDSEGVSYHLSKVGKLGLAAIYQLGSNGGKKSIDTQAGLFDLKPILLGDSFGMVNGQEAFSVESAWLKSLNTEYGLVVGKIEQEGVFKNIDADYVPMRLAYNNQFAGTLLFDLSGQLLSVRSDKSGDMVTSEQIKAFLQRYSSDNKNFAAVNLGVKCLDLDKTSGLQLGLKVDYGCLIADGLTDSGAVAAGGISKKSPAEKAGLKSGDVILEIDNNSLLKANLGQFLLNEVAGDKVDLLVLRDGKTSDITVTL